VPPPRKRRAEREERTDVAFTAPCLNTDPHQAP
jgi:hypothetical protein